MKKFFLLFVLSLSIGSNVVVAEKCVRGSTGWGFFAEFLWALNHLHFCKTNSHLTPVIYWGQSFAYYCPQGYNGKTNCWEYYFEPVSQLSYAPGDHLHTLLFYPHDNNFSTLWDYVQYVQNFRLLKPDDLTIAKLSNFNFLYGGSYPVAEHLYSKKFRKYVKTAVIDPYIRIKKSIQNIINAFHAAHMHGKRTVGLHLRGKFIGNESPFVETSVFLDYVNKHFADGKTQFFVSTDQKHLLETARNTLKGKVIYYESQRFDTTTSPIAGQAKLHPILGENVLIEMVLLSNCDHLVHGLSNVSTTALYFNPDMGHTLLY